MSLNNELIQGPNLTRTLLGVLLRFRKETVGLMADIEGMFHQVKVSEADKDFLRFVWWPKGDVSKRLAEYRMTVHLFGATSSSFASYALRKSSEDNKNNFFAEAIHVVKNNFFVDDCLVSVPTEKQANVLYNELCALCSQGGFRLVKWTSNSRQFLASIPEEDRAVHWSVEKDTFKFKDTLQNQTFTRRGILSVVNPLGFVAPFILTAKYIMQELCKLSYGWDDRIPDSIIQPWRKWLSGLKMIENFDMTRCVN